MTDRTPIITIRLRPFLIVPTEYRVVGCAVRPVTGKTHDDGIIGARRNIDGGVHRRRGAGGCNRRDDTVWVSRTGTIVVGNIFSA